MEKITTTHRDYDFTYSIYAYRKLTPEECVKVVSDYMNLPDHEWPATGKIIQIDTDIQ